MFCTFVFWRGACYVQKMRGKYHRIIETSDPLQRGHTVDIAAVVLEVTKAHIYHNATSFQHYSRLCMRLIFFWRLRLRLNKMIDTWHWIFIRMKSQSQSTIGLLDLPFICRLWDSQQLIVIFYSIICSNFLRHFPLLLIPHNDI